MNWLTNLAAGMRALFQKNRIDKELDEELDGYLAASAQHKQRAGMSPEAARRAALAEMGSRNSVKHQVWSSRWESVADNLMQDIRVSLRSLMKSPGFTAIALLSLALGIGGNTAIFTLIHQVILKDLPVRDPQQLVTFGPSTGGGILGGIDVGTFDMFPYDFARQLEADPGPFQGVAAYGSFSPKVAVRNEGASSSGPAQQVTASMVSGNYFSLLGAAPLLGRTIMPSDETGPESAAVAVVSYHYWQQSLSSDPAVLGKAVSINSTPFVIIGVMPEVFHGITQELEPPAIWAPITMQPEVLQQPSFLHPRSAYFLHMFARLNPKASVGQSQQWLDQQIHAYIRAGESGVISADRQQEINRATNKLTPASTGVSPLRKRFGDSLWVLMVVVALVLLIACANLANFLLARATTRQREVATRFALGSSKGRIVRQSLIETMLLSLAGGLLGLLLAFAATRMLISFFSHGADYTSLKPTPDGDVLLFTLGVSLLTGLIFGLAPAFVSASTRALPTLTATSRTSSSGGGRTGRLLPKALVAAQVMLSVLLLVGAGLFLRTLQNLQNQDFGFERTHLLLVEFSAKMAGYKPSQVSALHQQLLERLAALPGVRSAALAGSPPVSFGSWNSSLTIPGYTPKPKENVSTTLNRVSADYFATAGIPIVKGRAIGEQDTPGGLKVAVINQAFVDHYFPKGDAIGRSIALDIGSVKGPWQIVGIARDTKSGDPRGTPSLMFYMPLDQIDPMTQGDAGPEENQDRFADNILVRTTGDPSGTIAGLRHAMAEIDPKLPILQVMTIHEQISSLMAGDELISSLTGIFSILALLLASIGLYGVMSYSVARRTNEIGIRLALGARAAIVLWMVLRESLVLLIIGLALGLPLTYAATGVLKAQLFGLSAIDPPTFGIAIGIVSGMTILAALLPARRATRVDPMVALRCD